MKLVRYVLKDVPLAKPRMGIMLDKNIVGDLRAGYANKLIQDDGDSQGRELAALRFPGNLTKHLALGCPGRQALEAATEWLSTKLTEDSKMCGIDGEPLFTPLSACRLLAPLVPGKVIAVGRNYIAHLKEAGSNLPMSIPSSWIKAPSCMTGPFDDVVKPNAVAQLDYETELTFVIGQRCRNVPESRAYEVIAGYTILNDFSARDVVRQERAEGNQMLGKMFDGFAPTGPWVITQDDIPDPMDLAIRTRVNGEPRQDARTADMHWSIPKLVAFLSQMTLEPGDLITTGTPEGVAMGRKEEPSWFLEPGDTVECEVERIGMIRNRIVKEAPSEQSWHW